MGVLNLVAKDHELWVSVVKMFGIHDHAEDVVQDMYLKIAESSMVTERNYKGYVYTTLKHLVYDYSKDKRYYIELNDNLTEDTNKTDGHLDWLDIQKALHNLPYFERQVVNLHKVEGISLCEIQSKTDLCKVKMWRSEKKALDKLKRWIGN